MVSPVQKLIEVLRHLPGLGQRSAERIALRLLRDRSRHMLHDLTEALQAVEAEACLCSQCGAITTKESNPCRLCVDPTRDDHLLCVVSQPGDIEILEKSGAFRGRYHALMGRISPREGEGPRALRLHALLRRVAEGSFSEIVLALDTDVESDATAQYLAARLKEYGVRISRLAYGLPAGSGVAYSDSLTLSRALKGRHPLEF